MTKATTEIVIDEIPTFESMLITVGRTIKGLEQGKIMPAAGNAIFRGAQTVGQYAKIELEAVRLLGMTPKLMPRLLGGIEVPSVASLDEK